MGINCSFHRVTEALKVSTEPETPSCSFFKDTSTKENVSTSKSEVQKLSMEPLKMKRKKTGGYNLRKSLAWNKAFFTEEGGCVLNYEVVAPQTAAYLFIYLFVCLVALGVLDPIELSVISGTFANASGGGLCPIEERKTPQSSKSLRNVASSSMKSIKKNICKEISTTSSKEDREKVCFWLTFMSLGSMFKTCSVIL